MKSTLCLMKWFDGGGMSTCIGDVEFETVQNLVAICLPIERNSNKNPLNLQTSLSSGTEFALSPSRRWTNLHPRCVHSLYIASFILNVFEKCNATHCSMCGMFLMRFSLVSAWQLLILLDYVEATSPDDFE